MTIAAARAHNNRQLFSNWFLDDRLRRDALWSESSESANAVREELRTRLRKQEAALERANEAQTETRWIRPVLRALGWGFEVQPANQRQGSRHVPDYALFLAQTDADAAAALGDRAQLFNRATGVLEAKRWERDLDGRAARRDGDERIPSAQIINYLVRTEQRWGILTNGREWRLYFRDADFADSVYFGIDLPALLGDDPLALGEASATIPAEEAFRYFHLFFRPEAFREEPGGKRWLDLARDSSTRYARAVEDALKPRAYRAVTALVRGFVAAGAVDSSTLAADPQRGRELLDNALTLLFRLMFVLYGEARDLLPIRTSPAYRGKSLLELRERVARMHDEDRPFFPRGRDLWNDLRDLFRIIDGAAEWRLAGVPVYNGGLFDPAKHPWLDEHYAADPFLAEALDLLSRVEDPEDDRLHYVDYSPLDVRHLGSIYEGLLEYVVRVAGEDLPAIREQAQVVRDPVSAGELYLATDRGERRTTGSYYTPDYIVQYIVERTLGPLVEGKTVEEILALRILDPAMGSGHFLVAATAFLARSAVHAAEESSQLQLAEMGTLSPDHLRRLVVERCIFGVDRNPRAVELAKLALWLATVQHGKALNFLDHHLKCGDSLLGSRADDLARLPGRRGRENDLEAAGQYGAFSSAFHARLIKALADLDAIRQFLSDRAEQVQAKDQLYRHAHDTLQRLRDVGDLWMAAWFPEGRTRPGPAGARRTRARRGMVAEPMPSEVNGDRYDRALAQLRSPDAEWQRLLDEPWFARASDLSRTERFFHWDVEFAEAFFDVDGSALANPGFDAVVGNPPYVRMEEFSAIKDFLRGYYETYETRSDLYVYFVERSLELLRDGGEYGVILSNKFLRANYGKPLRRFLARDTSVREIVDLGGLPIFPEATVRAMILLARRGESTAIRPMFADVGVLEPERFAAIAAGSATYLGDDVLLRDEWVLVPAGVAAILDKLTAAGQPLGDYVGDLGRGIVTGLNEAFFIDSATRERLIAEDARSQEVIKPLVVGDSVRRYHVENDDGWLLYLPRGVDSSRFPAILNYLEQFRRDLAARATIGSHEWYELQQPQMAYAEFFEGRKILYPEITKEARFAFHPGPLYPNNKCFLIPGDDWYLLALLNSRLVFFVLMHVGAKLEGPSHDDRYLELRAQYMERLPIARVAETTEPAARAELGDWFRSLYFRGLRLAGLEPEIPDD
ncbi:MAG: Eco57I restriction-modification methylase domain-containing protein, partial [Gemmatimonadaceae bacterium]